MELGDFFKILEDLEFRMSELYDVFAKSLSDDADAVEVFKSMKADELAHRDVVKLAWKLAAKNKYHYDKQQIGAYAAEFNKNLSELKILINSGKKYTLEEAFRIALKLETSMFDRHRTMVLDFVDKKLADFVKQLGSSDERHVDKLKKFAEMRGMQSLIPAEPAKK